MKAQTTQKTVSWNRLTSVFLGHSRSKQLGWLGFAWQLFRRLNMHTCTFREVVHTITSKPVKMLPIIEQILLTKSSGFLVFSMATSYCDKAHTAGSTCTQLSSYAKPEITSLIPHALSSFPLFAVCILPARDRKLGGSQGTRLLI